MRKILSAIPLIMLLTLILSACSTQTSSQPASIVVTPPSPGKGAMSGQIMDASSRWNGATVFVFAASYYGDETSVCFFMLAGSLNPKTELQAGDFFQMTDITPGQYVLVVGPTAEEGVLVVNDKNNPLLIDIKADQVTELGKLNLKN